MGKLIGILEDDAGIMEILKFLLSEEGYRVEGYTTVSAFFSKNNSSPDLFILDVMLPDGNGLEVCRILKSGSKTAVIPVIMMSAHADLEQMNSGCQAEEFVKKPFDIFEMLEKIKHLLSKINEK